jgi:putative transposase
LFGAWDVGLEGILTLSSPCLYNVGMNTKIAYKSNHNVYYSCKYHVVWCPKYRRKVLGEQIAARLEQIIREVCEEHQSEILSLEIMPDHVHLLVECDPQFGIHRLVRLIKGRSSRFLRQEFPTLKTRMPTLWTNSYFVSTVGGASLSVIKQYIEKQKHV